jgi:predicted double-glycine peptidase
MRPHGIARLAIGLAVALGAGAGSAGTVEPPLQIGGAFSVKVRSLKEARFAATVHQQYDFSCGSAALSTLLTHHYAAPTTEQRIFEDMFARGDQAKIRAQGFSLLDMKQYLERRGFEADGFEASLSSLAEAGIPAIALINESGYNHFVVIKGVLDGRVLVGDPSGGTRAMAADRFEALRANPILFVINDRQDIARFNRADEWAALPQAPVGVRRDASAATLPGLAMRGASDF